MLGSGRFIEIDSGVRSLGLFVEGSFVIFVGLVGCNEILVVGNVDFIVWWLVGLVVDFY